MKIHLGVIDIPYASEHGKTTGEVAEILEKKYEVMQRFVGLNEKKIADDLAQGAHAALEDLMLGAPTSNPYGTAMGKIETDFREYLDHEKIAGTGAPGVPTKAALQGKSVRFKRRRGPRRPSFIDSGDYEASFKAWVEE